VWGKRRQFSSCNCVLVSSGKSILNTTPNAPFWGQIIKNFLGRGLAPSLYTSLGAEGDALVRNMNILKYEVFYSELSHRHIACVFMFRVLQADKGMVCEQLKILIGRNLIKEMEPDKWVRNVLDKTTGRTLLYYYVDRLWHKLMLLAFWSQKYCILLRIVDTEPRNLDCIPVDCWWQCRMTSVMHGRCDARPTVTFPAVKCHRHWPVPNYTA